MKTVCPVHSFDVSFGEAKRIQGELSKMVDISDSISSIDDVDIVGGADVAFISTGIDFNKPHDNKKTFRSDQSSYQVPIGSHKQNTGVIALASVVTYDVKQGCITETAYATSPVFFPYVPGFLSFRESPAILAAFGKLTVLPDVMFYDGCGIAHPRGLGLASHMSLLTSIPSVGCAKSLLCGNCEEPGHNKGEWSYIIFRDSIVGTCLRTRKNVRPVYVSPGSGFSVDGAREMVLSLAVKYRLPEPTRLAHNLVSEKKRAYLS